MYRKQDAKSPHTTTRLLILIVGLGIGVFLLDLSLPLGIGNSVLYGGGALFVSFFPLGSGYLCSLRRVFFCVFSLAISERPTDHGDHLLCGRHDRYHAEALTRWRATVDGRHQSVGQADGDLAALAVLPASATG